MYVHVSSQNNGDDGYYDDDDDDDDEFPLVYANEIMEKRLQK